MKKILITALSVCFAFSASAQILLKNNQGEQLFSHNENLRGMLLQLNTSGASLGADYFFNTKQENPSKYFIFRLGASAKANEGTASVLKGGQLSPGVNFNAGITLVGLSTNEKVSDWIELKGGYSVNKHKLFDAKAGFSDQISSKQADGYTIGAAYTMNFGKDFLHFFSLQSGFTRKSNYAELNSVDIQDYREQVDPTTNTTRRYGNTQSIKEGTLSMRSVFPMIATFTFLPDPKRPRELEQEIDSKTGQPIIPTKEELKAHSEKATALFKSPKLGYAVFFGPEFTTSDSPTQTKLGGTVFLISPNKEDILTSRIGLTAELADLFDTKKAGTSHFKRMSIGLTVNFSL